MRNRDLRPRPTSSRDDFVRNPPLLSRYRQAVKEWEDTRHACSRARSNSMGMWPVILGPQVAADDCRTSLNRRGRAWLNISTQSCLALARCNAGLYSGAVPGSADFFFFLTSPMRCLTKTRHSLSKFIRQPLPGPSNLYVIWSSQPTGRGAAEQASSIQSPQPLSSFAAWLWLQRRGSAMPDDVARHMTATQRARQLSM